MKTSSSCSLKTEISHTAHGGAGILKTLTSLKFAALLLAAMCFSALTARASDPIGVYTLVDKVVFEPSDSAPERIQIWGAFALAQGRGYEYGPAQKGYLYYKLNPQKKDVTLKEWSDLKSVAGTKQVVGFGNRYEDKGKVRTGTEKAANPDVYPIGFGLIKSRDDSYAPVKELLGLADQKKEKKETSAGAAKKSS